MFSDLFRQTRKLSVGAAIAITVLGAPGIALADCANPAAPEGRLIYNSTSKVVQFCDGTNWIGMGGGGGGGGGASALVGLSDVDSASAGTGNVLIYNAVSGNWESVAVGSDTQIIFNDGGALSGNAGLVFDKANVRVGVGVATPTQPVDVAGLMTSDGILLKSVAGDPPTMAGAANLGDLADVDTSGAADGLVLKYNGTSSAWEAAGGGGGATQWTDAGSDIYFSGGNVGIGTTGPTGTLHVYGDGPRFRIQDDGNANSYFEIHDPQSTQTIIRKRNASGATMIDVSPLADDGTSTAYIRLLRETNTTGGRGLQIHRGDNTPTVDHALLSGTTANSYLAANGGNVGIGTTAPSALLQVGGAATNMQLTGNDLTYYRDTDGDSYINKIDAGRLIFRMGSGLSAAMAITTSGNVGIGATNPQAPLEVWGNTGYATLRLRNTGTASGKHWNVGPDTNNALIVYNQGVAGVWIGDGATAWAAQSDRRLKEQIETLPGALDRVAALRGVYYFWKDKEGHSPDRQIGVIAQEIRQVYPELVTEDARGNMGVNYSGLVAPLIEAVKELKAANDDLRAEFEAYKAEHR